MCKDRTYTVHHAETRKSELDCDEFQLIKSVYYYKQNVEISHLQSTRDRHFAISYRSANVALRR